MTLPALRRPPLRVRRGSALTSFASVLLGLLLTNGCGDPVPDGASPREDIAQRSCEARFACTCEEHAFRDEDECERSTRANLATLEVGAEATGLRVDWTCVEAREVALHYGCATYDEVEAEKASECATCRPVHGDVGVGEVCRNYGDFNDCEQGLRCVSTVDGWRCVDACHPTEGSYCEYPRDCDASMDCRGDRCTPKIALGEPCDNSNYCVDGAFCGYDDVCAPLADLGEPCVRDELCRDDAYCSEGVCVAQGSLGDPCTTERSCPRELYCQGVCVAPPGAGDPCVYGICGASATCDAETERCVADPPRVCAP